MRYYGFIIKANNALIAKNTKIRLREYDFESNIGALNLYMYRNLRNGQLFVAYREEGDSLLGISDFFRQTGVPQLGETLQDHSRDDR